MLADGNHDRRMDDSESDSDQLRLTTPTHPTVLPNALSPPDSQQRSRMATAASGSNIANSNGKRPLQTTGNGPDDMGGESAAARMMYHHREYVRAQGEEEIADGARCISLRF